MGPLCTKRIIFGFILAIGITLALPHFSFGASRSFGGSGRLRASTIPRQHFFVRPFNRFGLVPFNRFGFFGPGGVVGGVIDEQPAIIIQQFQPAPVTQLNGSATNRVYVQPRWVDGGHGVEVLQPGYWTEPKQAEKR